MNPEGIPYKISIIIVFSLMIIFILGMYPIVHGLGWIKDKVKKTKII